MSRARIVVTDRYPVVLEGLGNLLKAESDFEIVASCRDSVSCLNALRTYAPDILIFDVLMQGVTAHELLSIINTEQLMTHLVLFVSSEDPDEYELTKEMGAYTVIPKSLPSKALLLSLRRVAGIHDAARISAMDQGVRQHTAIGGNALSTLTERERQIVQLVSEGLSNKEVARRLRVTKGTIKVHLHHIFQKLDIRNRTVLAALALSNGENNIDVPDKPLAPT